MPPKNILAMIARTRVQVRPHRATDPGVRRGTGGDSILASDITPDHWRRAGPTYHKSLAPTGASGTTVFRAKDRGALIML